MAQFSQTQRTQTENLQRLSAQKIPQTGLALMGFSRYCPSSLDLTNFVVRGCRGGVADGAPAGPSRPRPGPGLGLGIWKSGDLEIQKFGIHKIKKTYIYIYISKCKSVLPKMSARSGLVGKKSSWPHLGPSQAFFPMDRQNPKNIQKKYIFSLVGRPVHENRMSHPVATG